MPKLHVKLPDSRKRVARTFLALKNGSRHPAVTDGLLILLFAGWFCFYNLDNGSFSSDETLSVRTTQSILETGDLFHLSLGGLKSYYGKPPLKMWLNALAVLAFGESNFSYRFVDALFGLATCFLVYFIALRLFTSRIAGLVAVAGLLGCETYLILHGVRRSVQDSMLVFFFTVGMWLAWLILVRLSPEHARSHPGTSVRNEQYRLAIFLGLFIGIAAFTKTIAAYIIFFVLGLYVLLVPERWSVLKRGSRLLAVILFLAILVPAPYWIYRCREGTGVCSGVLAAPAVDRGLAITKVSPNQFAHFRHLFVEQSAVDPLLFLFSAAYACVVIRCRGDRRFLYVLNWAAAPYFIFTLLKGTYPWYTAPAYPAMALLIGVTFDELRLKLLKMQQTAASGPKASLVGALLFFLFLITMGLTAKNLLKCGLEVAAGKEELPMNQFARAVQNDKNAAVFFLTPLPITTREAAYRNMVRRRTRIFEQETVLQQELQNVAGQTAFILLTSDRLPAVFAWRRPSSYLEMPPVEHAARHQWKIALTFNREPEPPFLPPTSVYKLDRHDAPLLSGWSGIHHLSGPADTIRLTRGPASAVVLQGGISHRELGGEVVLYLARAPKIKAPLTIHPYFNHHALPPFNVSRKDITTYRLPVPGPAFLLGENVLELAYETPYPLRLEDELLLTNQIKLRLGPPA